MKICKECSNEITGKGRLFCSSNCKAKSYAKRDAGKNTIELKLKCHSCNKDMIGSKRKRFCGDENAKGTCAYEYRLSKVNARHAANRAAGRKSYKLAMQKLKTYITDREALNSGYY